MTEPVSLPPSSPLRRDRPSKLLSAREAVQRFVHDGDSVFFGYTSWAGGLEREVARQRKQNLTSLATVGSILLPLLGTCPRLITSYALGAQSPWFLERYRAGEFEIEDYTNQTIALMFMAGALGMPFVPTKAMLGSDYLAPDFYPEPGGFLGENKLHVMDSPFDGERVVLLPALRPNVSCVHVQWADEEGNAAFWGGHGEVRWGLWASERVIISAEEIVPTTVLRSDPHRVTIPGFMVDAVVHMPFGSLPWGLPGYYNASGAMQYDFLGGMRTEEGFKQVLDTWVDGCADHDATLRRYEERYGAGSLDRLRADRTWFPERPIRYGWRAAQ